MLAANNGYGVIVVDEFVVFLRSIDLYHVKGEAPLRAPVSF